MTSGEQTLYVIILSKKPDREFTPEAIQAHVDHLKKLDEDGALLVCGPFTDWDGGMMVLRASSKEAATEIARRDPFVKDGFENYEVRTLNRACAENNFLLDG